MREIDVDVREFVQRHAFLVEKAAEIQIEANGAHAADAQAVADEAVRRAAARDPVEPAPPAFLQQVPGDEKVFLVADVADDAEFLFELGLETGELRGLVTVARPAQDETAEKLARPRTVRRMK